jgi:hypothetical protein
MKVPNATGSDRRKRISRKVLLGLGLTAPVLAGVAMIPSVASGGEQADEPDRVAHDHSTHDHAAMTTDVQNDLAQVRRATAKYHRLDAAVAAGYELGWVNGDGMRIVAGCVTHPTMGAMGYHYFNEELMADNAVNALEPEALVYAPDDEGRLHLAAVEWVARSAQSNPPGVSEAPSVLGMDMHILVPPPGPAFYLKHAWVWSDNPSGMFADWNPEVSCS